MTRGLKQTSAAGFGASGRGSTECPYDEGTETEVFGRLLDEMAAEFHRVPL